MWEGTKRKKLSIIIPTLNRADLLKQTLESIHKQTFSKEDFEVIVIDNGSVDHTKEVCVDYQKVSGNLRYIYDNRPGLHIGRNRGYLESKSDILVYADDDIIAYSSWLEAIYEGFKDEKTVLIGGNNYPYFECAPPRWLEELWIYNEREKAKRLETHSIIIMGNEPRRVKPGMVFGCNFAIRKKIVKEAGGFHPDGVPDIYLKYRGDGESYVTSYINRYNMKVMFYPEALVYHMVTKQRMTKQYVQKVAYRSGISAGYARLRALPSLLDYPRVLRDSVVSLYNNKIHKNEKNIRKIKNYYLYKGYLYIVIQFGISKKVRNWIARSNYINARIPQ